MPHPTVAGRYRLVEQIGAGGMGVVWRAEDERLRRPVAVKLLRPPIGLSEDEAELATQRAMREARITARLHHPHAVSVFDVVEHEGRPGLVMQYVPSVPLSAVLREGGPLSLDETARLGAEVASALAAAHQLDIVHRDVKPGNILVAEDGSAMLSDFGISRVLGDATLTVTGMVHGTPAYLAPEVARGASSDAATDVYSLGATLYAALEGRPPFGSDPNPIVLLHLVASGDFPPPQRSGPLTPLLLRMLAVDPGGRPTMATVASELAALRIDLAQGVQPTRPLAVPAPAVTSPAPEQPAPAPPADLPADTQATPLLPAAAAAPTEQTTRRPAVPAPRRRRGAIGWVVAVVLLLLVVGLGYAVLHDGGGSGAGIAASPSAARTPASSRSTSSSTSSATTSTSASSSPTESASSSSPTPSDSPSPSPSSTPSPSASAGEARLVEGVTSYYALLPRDTEAGWERLTGRYRSATGGRKSYDQFWGEFSAVSTSKVTATGADQVEATVSYVGTDGRKSSERRSFTLVEDDGELKIDASSRT
ncbi:serine/threonine-protein kinase [uncultured Friedmanniella sp.]|uniref:serine/threonine-protein kinase n=1 Tax=uncultured Friedmanniella sp. TaxID=335381 RepID=UPI0035CAC55D